MDVTPVVEDVVRTFEVRLGYRKRFERRSEAPLVLMTRRRRLDAFLAEQAAAAGADFRDGVTVEGLTVGPDGATIRIGGAAVHGRVLVGADGVNGRIARDAGLGGGILYGIALEGNGPLPDAAAPGARRSSSASSRAGTAGCSRRRITPTTASAAGRPRARGCARTCAGSAPSTGSTTAVLTDAAGPPAADPADDAAPPAARCCSSATRPVSSIRSRATGSTRRSSRPDSRPRRSSMATSPATRSDAARGARPLRGHVLEGEARARSTPAGGLRDRTHPGGLARDRADCSAARSRTRAMPAAWHGRRCACWRASKEAHQTCRFLTSTPYGPQCHPQDRRRTGRERHPPEARPAADAADGRVDRAASRLPRARRAGPARRARDGDADRAGPDAPVPRQPATSTSPTRPRACRASASTSSASAARSHSRSASSRKDVPSFERLEHASRRRPARERAPRPRPRHRRDRLGEDDDARLDARPHQPDAEPAHRHDRGPDRDPPSRTGARSSTSARSASTPRTSRRRSAACSARTRT